MEPLSTPDLKDLIIDDQERAIFRVHRSSMVSHSIFEQERSLIFDQVWLYVGHDSEVPNAGDYCQRTINGRPMFFARGNDGVVRCFFNTCTHRGAMICRQEQGHTEVFQCFYHAWTFNTQGELIGIPDDSGYPEDFDRCERALKTPVRHESYGGFHFVSFNPGVEPLTEFLGYATDWIDSCLTGFKIQRGSLKYTMRCNWKLQMENSEDGYHVPTTHKTYVDYVRDAVGEPPKDSQIYKRLAGVGNMGLPQGHALSGSHLYLYPNVIFVSGPTLRTFWPIAPNEIEIRSFMFRPAEEDPEVTAERINTAQLFQGPGGFATPDDVEALESCQIGFSAGGEEWSDISRGMRRESMHPTGFPVGRGNDELAMRNFWRRWHADLQGARVHELQEIR